MFAATECLGSFGASIFPSQEPEWVPVRVGLLTSGSGVEPPPLQSHAAAWQPPLAVH